MVGGGEQLWPGQLADNLMALRPNIRNTHQGISQALLYWIGSWCIVYSYNTDRTTSTFRSFIFIYMFSHVKGSSISISDPRHHIAHCWLSTTSPPPHICHDLDAGGGAARGGGGAPQRGIKHSPRYQQSGQLRTEKWPRVVATPGSGASS